MLQKKTNGFTLVELLVVISILGILAGALTMQVTKARSIGQSVRCKANLRNLAQAALNYGVDHEGLMPCAGSYERRWVAKISNAYRPIYREVRGWVSWTGSGRWNASPDDDFALTAQAPQMKKACYYGDTAYFSITNGVLWSYVGKDLSAYACDVHKSVAKRASLSKVQRSYVMNAYFGFDNSVSPTMADWRAISIDALSARGSAGNMLLFAELPAFTGSAHAEKVATDAFGTGSDGVLETDISGYRCTQTEVFGFNHQVAKRYVAHAAFADGHVDVLVEPLGSSSADLKELAKQLCNGAELSQTLRDKMR
jgi:prepilin-type N-terminal cleavage/methylation domain-containing protein/prepilin-type processing-associated H-X9-DG protein